MALANYDDLKAAVAAWMTRSDMAGQAADFITLGEAALNRELPAVETDTPLTGVVDSRRIDISAVPIIKPIALFLTDPNLFNELQLTPKADGTFTYQSTSGQPRYWAIDGTNIDFDCPLDQAYTFRFRNSQRFALSDTSPTNWLLTNHPDVYLAAVLVWGGVFTRNPSYLALYAPILDTALPSVRNVIAQQKRAELTVDPALQSIGRRAYYGGGWA